MGFCVNILQLFLKVPLVGLHFVIVVFPDHTHLLFYNDKIWVGIVTCHFSLFCNIVMALDVSISFLLNILRTN